MREKINCQDRIMQARFAGNSLFFLQQNPNFQPSERILMNYDLLTEHDDMDSTVQDEEEDLGGRSYSEFNKRGNRTLH
jgi:hypothetical protein